MKTDSPAQNQHRASRGRRIRLTVAGLILALTAGAGFFGVVERTRTNAAADPYVMTRLTAPDRTTVSDRQGHWLATFTNQARTVQVAGAARTFSEARTTRASVTHDTWIRILPRPFDGTVDQAWLTRELADTSPDILAIAMQYIYKAPRTLVGGQAIAGDASYGPEVAGRRKEGSDFSDYLGVPWIYGGIVDPPEAAQINAMDCSGYMRMVWGYRGGMRLGGPHDAASSEAIPRRAYEIQAEAPGIIITPDTHTQVKDFSKLAIGDIVFFDGSTNDGQRIDHNGMYLGRDTKGHYRFISSRKSADGPTMGDVGGSSILDGYGHYALAYRSERRF